MTHMRGSTLAIGLATVQRGHREPLWQYVTDPDAWKYLELRKVS